MRARPKPPNRRRPRTPAVGAMPRRAATPSRPPRPQGSRRRPVGRCRGQARRRRRRWQGPVGRRQRRWRRASADSKSEFSDAVALQFPVTLPTSIRKPYFIFGDKDHPVHLWFADLAKKNPTLYLGQRQRQARGARTARPHRHEQASRRASGASSSSAACGAPVRFRSRRAASRRSRSRCGTAPAPNAATSVASPRGGRSTSSPPRSRRRWVRWPPRPSASWFWSSRSSRGHGAASSNEKA